MDTEAASSGRRPDDAYQNADNDPRGPWIDVSFSVTTEDAEKRIDYRYDIVLPDGTIANPPVGRHWNGLRPRYEELLADGRIWFGESGDRTPRVKVFLSEVQQGIVPDTWWRHSDVGSNQDAKREILEIFGGTEPFSTPKPVGLVKRVLEITDAKLVLDSFAGSGTTAHAVLKQNALDAGDRKFILVEMEDYANDVTAERVRRVISGYPYQGTQRETLLEKALTWSELKRGDALVQDAENMKTAYEGKYDRVKITVDKAVLKVIGERDVDEMAPGLGGTFTYCTLGEPLYLDKMLFDGDLPTRKALESWLLYLSTGEAHTPITGMTPPGQTTTGAAIDAELEKLFLGQFGETYYWMIYELDRAFLSSPKAALTLDLARRICAVAPRATHRVFSPVKYVSTKLLRENKLNIEHATIPFALFRKGG